MILCHLFLFIDDLFMVPTSKFYFLMIFLASLLINVHSYQYSVLVDGIHTSQDDIILEIS